MSHKSLWSLIRAVLEQGYAIRQDDAAGKYPTYEHLSARMDEAARERTPQFEALNAVEAESYGPMLAAEFNALPDRLKSYIHDLETRADPAGDVRLAFVAEEKAMALEALLAERDATIAELRDVLSDTSIRATQAQLVAEQSAFDCDKLQIELAELRKPVAVEPNGDVESARAVINNPNNICGLTKYAQAVLSAHDALRQGNARWVRARDAWEAEMRGLRERLSGETIAANQHFADLLETRERERQLREALTDQPCTCKWLSANTSLPCNADYPGAKRATCSRCEALSASPAPVEGEREQLMQVCNDNAFEIERQSQAVRWLMKQADWTRVEGKGLHVRFDFSGSVPPAIVPVLLSALPAVDHEGKGNG